MCYCEGLRSFHYNMKTGLWTSIMNLISRMFVLMIEF
jgi:hypothetical protein